MIYLFHQVPVSPLTLYTIMFMLGIASEQCFSHSFVIFSIVTLWLLLFYCVSLNKKLVYFICSCFATTGGWYVQKYQSRWHSIANIVAQQKITVNGVILNSVPSLNSPNTLQYTLYVTDSSESALKNSCLALYVKNNKKIFNPGETIIIENAHCLLAPPHFAAYLIKEGFTTTIYSSFSNISKLNAKKPFWAHFYTRRFALLTWSKNLFSSSTYALFSSLFLGYKWNEPIEKNRETFSPFKFWGISHYIARSGLHLAILIMLWHVILSYMPFAWHSKQWILIISSLFYFTCTWSSTSFLRALISFIIGRLFVCVKETAHFIHIIALTALCMLLYNPTLLFFLDFQLSFGMTFALAWLSNIPGLRKTLAK